MSTILSAEECRYPKRKRFSLLEVPAIIMTHRDARVQHAQRCAQQHATSMNSGDHVLHCSGCITGEGGDNFSPSLYLERVRNLEGSICLCPATDLTFVSRANSPTQRRRSSNLSCYMRPDAFNEGNQSLLKETCRDSNSKPSAPAG